MSKVKLLYALESAGGGTLKHVTYLATRLDQNKFDITVVLSNANYEKDTASAVSKMRQKGVRVDIIGMTKNISPLKDIFTLCNIYSYLQKHRFDIVHAHSSKAGGLFRLAACWTHVPVVIYTPHCFHFTAYLGVKRRLFAGIERFFAQKTSCIVISGTEQAALYKESIKAIKETVVIDNAIEPNEYKLLDAQQVRQQWHIPLQHRVIVGVGRLVEQKSWDIFLKAAKMALQHNKDITFMIAGGGPHHKYLSRLIHRWRISANVILCGHLDDVSPVYSIADAFVSTSRWEGLPYTYLEALHFNVPMLIMHTEGMEYFLKHAGAICILQNDCSQLSEAIVQITLGHVRSTIDSPVHPFEIKQFIEQHQQLYDRLLK